MSQQKIEKPYQFVYTDFIGPITLIGFKAEKYFFTFIDNYTRIIKTYIVKQKSKKLKSLKAFYNFIRICTDIKHLIQRL